jgi:hypothetical protein
LPHISTWLACPVLSRHGGWSHGFVQRPPYSPVDAVSYQGQSVHCHWLAEHVQAPWWTDAGHGRVYLALIIACATDESG